ncbi:MAG TPA: hypothetical protein VLS45_10230, partial [Methylomicrobium sp.]|nr:hypothetical protein [Methylomicrobium sp.]
MNIKKVVPTILPIVFGLVACATDSPSKYRDVENLAHPPKVQGESANMVMEDQEETEEASESGKEPLGNKVYKVDSKPATLRIKLPFKKGWYAVRLALKELDADIITFDRDGGLYTLKYKAEGQDSGQGGLLQGLL